MICSLFIAGCGTSNEEQEAKPTLKDAQLFYNMHEESKVLQKKPTPLGLYVFDKVELIERPGPIVGGRNVNMFAEYSSAYKNLVGSIWKGLQQIGFSGYDPSQLTQTLPYESMDQGIGPAYLNYAKQQIHHLLLPVILNTLGAEAIEGYNESFFLPSNKLKYARALLGLKFLGKQFTATTKDEKNVIMAFSSSSIIDQEVAFVLTEDYNIKPGYVPLKKDTDVIVTDAQIEAWSAIIENELKKDAFFGNALLEDATSGASLRLSRSSRHPHKGLLHVDIPSNEASTVLNIPLTIQHTGNLFTHNNSALNFNHLTSIAYTHKNIVMGVIHANQTVSQHHLTTQQSESSVAASIQHNKVFLEAQLGYVTNSKMGVLANNGMRSQLTVGYDFQHYTPFIQVISRTLKVNSDLQALAGIEVDFTPQALSSYAITTKATAKIGHNSLSGLTASLTSKLNLHLSNATQLSAALSLASNNAEVQVHFNLEQ